MKTCTPTSNPIPSHPYADAWPILSDEELADLAEDIKANGLRNPVVMYDGKILDGRNRTAACGRAGVKATFVEFEGTDDEALAFVQSINGARRHQSKGSLAASWALSMLAAGKRVAGRWEYGSAQFPESGKSWSNAMSQVGLLADIAPDLLIEVRDDRLALDAAYQRAKGIRDAEMELLAEQERIQAEEAAALAALPPEYAKQIGDKYSSARVAFAAWEDANRAEAARRRKALQQEEQAKRDRAEGIERAAKYLANWTTHYAFAAGLRDNPDREEILAAMSGPALRKYRAEFLALEAANDWRTA
jgi:hypothetical protein